MKGTRAALRYAKAILNLAKESKKETEVNGSMQAIVETIQGSSELEAVLDSPVIKVEDKIKVLNAVFSETIDQISLGVIGLLGENKRLPLLSEVAKQYSILFDHDKLVDVARVTTAVPLTKALSNKVLAKIKELTGHEATIENVVNPEIIGGFILRVGDIQYDASISSNFNELKRQFDNSHFVAKI